MDSDTKRWTDAEETLHERCSLLFFAGNSFLGEVSFDPGSASELGYPRGGRAFFCPDCGEVWGRIVLRDSRGQVYFQDIDRVACERHADQWEIPGSLLGGRLGDGFLAYLPPQALARELVVHLEWAINVGVNSEYTPT